MLSKHRENHGRGEGDPTRNQPATPKLLEMRRRRSEGTTRRGGLFQMNKYGGLLRGGVASFGGAKKISPCSQEGGEGEGSKRNPGGAF